MQGFAGHTQYKYRIGFRFSTSNPLGKDIKKGKPEHAKRATPIYVPLRDGGRMKSISIDWILTVLNSVIIKVILHES